MTELAYDLHIHSCLFALWDDDMTPAKYCGNGSVKRAGMQWLSQTTTAVKTALRSWLRRRNTDHRDSGDGTDNFRGSPRSLSVSGALSGDGI